MMKMKITIDEEKAKNDSEYTVDEMYNEIDILARKASITKKEKQGIYVGNNDRYDLANFGRMIIALSEREWFMKCVEEWLWYDEEEMDDMIEFYKSIRREAV